MSFAIEAANYIEGLEKIGSEVTISKGDHFDKKNIYYLKEGVAALTYLTKNGEQSSFLHFRSGMLLNFMRPIIDKTGIGSEITLKRFANLDHTIYAKTECKALSFNGEKFLEYLEEDPKRYKLLLRSVTENMINLLALSTDLVTKPANIRVCQVILDFMTDDEPPQIPRYLTYNEIAFYLSMHVVTVAKIFKALKKQGIIEKHGRTSIVIAPEKLIAIVNGEEKLDYLD